jgi:hypothetical protein
MTNLPTSPRTATTLVKSVLVGVDGMGEVHSRYFSDGVQTIVHLTGDANFDAALTFLRGAFADVVVRGSETGFISISFRPWSIEQDEIEAHSIDRADRNAQRYYRAARDVDLRRWLLRPTDMRPVSLDLWTIERRTRLMRRELASRDAELCRRDDHFDRFGETNDDVAGHVAAHLAELSR